MKTMVAGSKFIHMQYVSFDQMYFYDCAAERGDGYEKEILVYSHLKDFSSSGTAPLQEPPPLQLVAPVLMEPHAPRATEQSWLNIWNENMRFECEHQWATGKFIETQSKVLTPAVLWQSRHLDIRHAKRIFPVHFESVSKTRVMMPACKLAKTCMQGQRSPRERSFLQSGNKKLRDKTSVKQTFVFEHCNSTAAAD